MRKIARKAGFDTTRIQLESTRRNIGDRLRRGDEDGGERGRRREWKGEKERSAKAGWRS